MLPLSDVETFVAAFHHSSSNESVAALVARTGMRTATGVMLAVESVDPPERLSLYRLVEAAILEFRNEGSLTQSRS